MTAAGLLRTIVLVAAVAAGVTYVYSWTLGLDLVPATVWKGAGVGLLALYAALAARDRLGWLLAFVLAAGATGDVLLAVAGLTAGAVAFLVGHLAAVGLYLSRRRDPSTPGDLAAAAAILAAAVFGAWTLPADRELAPLAALYAVGLGAMAASAWISRFPRAWVGLGAVLFVASDLFLFARVGPLAGAPWIDLAVWATYFGGQTLICLGATRFLASERGG